jgi:hypothetical protein
MFRSFVSDVGTLAQVRKSGIDARPSEKFIFESSDDKGEMGTSRVVHVNVVGADGEELLEGAFQVASLFPSGASEDSGSTATIPQSKALQPEAVVAAKDGYHVQPYVGVPGVIGEGAARHFCAFPTGVDVRPARVSGPLHAGPLFDQLRFSMEGVLHLSDVQIVNLPPWGQHARRTAVGKRPEVETAVEGTEGEFSWKVGGEGGNMLDGERGTPPAPDPPDTAALLSNLLDARVATGAKGRPVDTPKSGSALHRRSGDSAPLDSKGGTFPWHLHEL